MNKILNINLGGMPFTIDIDAYTHLDNYLSTIRRHFSDSESCDEIIHDIEVRMGELFQESMKGSSIISNKELDDVIKIMGTPEDFGAEAIEDDYEPSHETSESYTERDHKRSGKKRLFRDGEDKIIGGLCSGMAAYFGIDDPLWIRIAFVLLLFAGISPVLYILLWVIVPVARTSSDKLAMRGENINISNIAKTVEEEITELSKRITEIGKDLKSKKKSSGHVDGDEEGRPKKRRNFILRGFAAVFGLIGGIFSAIFSIIGKTGKTIYKVVGGTLIGVLGLALIAIIIGISICFPFLKYVGPNNYFLSSLGGLSLYLTLGIPLFFGLSLIAKRLLGYKMKDNWMRNLGTMWIASIVVGAFSVSNAVSDYRVSGNISDSYSKSISNDIINIRVSDEHKDDVVFLDVAGLQPTNEGLFVDDIHLKIVKSKDHNIHVTKNIAARGTNKKDALSNAGMVKADFEINEEGNIIIPEKFLLPKGKNYRGQALLYTVAIPMDKEVKFDGATEHKLYGSSFDNSQPRPWNEENYTWKMGENGLYSEEYNEIANHELKIPIDKMKSLFIEGHFDIELVQADEASVSIVGNQDLVENVEYSSINGSVNIKNMNRYHNTPLKVYAYVTELDQLNLEDVNYTKLKGLTQENLSIYNSGRGDLTAVMDIENLQLNLDGKQSIDLMGKGENIDIQLSQNTDLDLSKYLVTNATLKGDLYRRGKLNVEKALNCQENTLRNLEVIGNPTISGIAKDTNSVN